MDRDRRDRGDRYSDGGNRRKSDSNSDGRRGGYNNNRSQSDRGYQNRGGNQRKSWGDSSDRQPERSSEERFISDLHQLIVRIGDKVDKAPLERNISNLVDTLTPDMNKRKVIILDIVFKCVLALPTKTPIYATIIALLNIKFPEIGNEVLQRVHLSLNTALQNNEAYDLKFLVRFLCELANCNVVEPDSIFSIFQKLLSDENGVQQGRRDFFTNIVMQALPYVGDLLFQTDPQKLNELFDSLNLKTTARDIDGSLCIAIFTNEKPIPRMRWVYDALSEHAKGGWVRLSVLLTPWKHFEEKLTAVTPHKWSEIIGDPQLITDGSGIQLPLATQVVDYPISQNIFRILDKEPHSLWEDRKLTDLDRFIIEEYIIDIVHFFSDSHKDCVKHLSNMPIQTPVDNILDILIETLFQELFNLPQSEFARIYYGLIFAEFCKSSLEFMPAILSKAILILYEKIGSLDIECFFIFTEWFAHHLSNFDYKWLWSQWNNPPDNVHEDFIREVLFRCTRLSYFERIEKTITPELSKFLPLKPKGNFKYLAGPHVLGYKAAQHLYNKMKNRIETSDQVLEWIRNSAEGEVIQELEPIVQVDVLVSCLVQVGSKSFSYLLASIDRYLPLLKQYVGEQESQQQAIQSVLTYWDASPQNVIITLSKFCKTGVIPSLSIIQWFFSPANAGMYKKHWPWELLHSTMQSSINHGKFLQKEIQKAKSGTGEKTKEETDKLKSLEDEYNLADEEIRDLFLVLFQNFEMVLKGALKDMDKRKKKVDEDKEEKDALDEYAVNIMLGQFKSFGRKYYRELRSLCGTLDILFSNTDSRIVSIYEQAKAIIVNY